MKNIAVITGDIIASSRLNKADRKKLPSLLKNCFSGLSKYYKKSLEGNIDIFGGDSYQFVVNDIGKSLIVALSYRLLLKSGTYGFGLDTKISIGIGGIDFIKKNKISESDSDAFPLSGRNLKLIDKKSNMTFTFPGFSQHDEFSIFVVLADELVVRYTEKQALAVFGALAGLNQEGISKLWKPAIKQQSVSKHLNNAGYFALEKLLNYYEHRLHSL